MLKNLTIPVIAILLIGCTTVKSVSDDDLKLLSEKSFLVQAGGILQVKSPVGNISVTTWDKNETSVKVYGNENAEDKLNFELTQNGVDVSVKAKFKEEKQDGGNFQVKYEIIVPKEYNIEADTKGGNIVVNGTKGYKELNTMGGNIKVENGEGSIKANTMGGNIKMITRDGKIEANTMGGNISLDYTGINNGIDLNTMGGNIHATLPSDINGDADFSTAAGKISCDFAEPQKDFASSSLKTKFNNGGEPISINTAAGNIHVEKKQ
jgi:hypothetical protein